MEALKFDGVFKIIDFSFTFKILLLRKTEIIDGGPFNIDLLFSGVFYIETPTILYDIVIQNGLQIDCDYIQGKCMQDHVGLITSERVFILYARGIKHYIGARKLEVITNEYNPMDTSIGVKK
jgi:hypothetical protein